MTSPESIRGNLVEIRSCLVKRVHRIRGSPFEFLCLIRYTVIPRADEEPPPEIVVHLEMLRDECH